MAEKPARTRSPLRLLQALIVAELKAVPLDETWPGLLKIDVDTEDLALANQAIDDLIERGILVTSRHPYTGEHLVGLAARVAAWEAQANLVVREVRLAAGDVGCDLLWRPQQGYALSRSSTGEIVAEAPLWRLAEMLRAKHDFPTRK